MFCFCRMLRHVSAVKSISNRTGVYCLQSFSSNHVHTQYSSHEYRENLFQEKGPFSELVQDIRSSETIWKKQHHNKVFQEFLKECFRKSDGSPLYAINLLRIVCDKSFNSSTDLISSLIIEFSRYLTDNELKFSPSVEEKLDAINSVLMSGNYPILCLVCKVFKIDGKEDRIKLLVDELVEHHKLIEAAFCVGALNLQKEYEIEDIVIPLLLNGKVQAVNACLLNQPDLQIEIAKKLDSKLANEKAASRMDECIRDTKRSKKALDSFIKHFKIPPKECKNLYYIRGRSALNHLTKRLLKQSIPLGRWEEMVMSILIVNPDLKQHLEYKLAQIYDKEIALKMMEKLEMRDFDADLITKSEDGINLDELEEINNEDTEITVDESHLLLPLADDAIMFVDTEDKFNDFHDDITKNYRILGIDTEWKPHFGLSKDRVSLIQLAVHDKVYILDALSLSECLSTEQWDKLNDNVFGNPNIIKLGCDMITDIQMIVNNNKGTIGKKVRFTHILDMVVFFERLQKTYPDLMKAEEENDNNNSMGLSKLCEAVLGKPLNKGERLCDWEKRPLSESQLGYAALDAYCLLQIYDKLKEISGENNMNFELQAKNSMVLTAAQSKPKKGFNQMLKEKSSKQRKKISIHDFKVAVDPELKVQGDQLEKLGADVLILGELLSPEDISKIVKTEGRMLICSEAMFQQVQTKIPPLAFFKSASLVDSYITISNILQRFNVYVPTSSFSHCKICHSKDTLELSSEQVNLLKNHLINKTELYALEDNANLHQILSNMRQSGIKLKFFNQSNSFSSETSKKICCKNCGTIQ